MSGVWRKAEYVLGTYWEAGWAMRRQYSGQRIRSVQNERLRRLLSYSFCRVKYYREAFEQAGVTPDQIRSVDDLPRLPILTKQELRDRLWDFLPHDLPACRVTRTSGSTGVPVCIFADWHSRRLNSAATVRFLTAVGIPLVGRPMLNLLKTVAEPRRAPEWIIAQGLHRKHYLNPYILSPENCRYAEILIGRLKRPILSGISSSLRAFAYAVRDGRFPHFEPAVILTGGEMLLPEVRELIERTFGRKVHDLYACNETRNIAWQCRRACGYHINADNVIVEIVRDGKPAPAGEVGEVILTDLNRYAMPIIRYRNGDLACLAKEPCPCGCQLPMLAGIVGRTGQNIRLPNGSVVLWNHLKSQMTHPLIRQFQLEQDRKGDFTIHYVPDKKGDIRELDTLLLRRFHAMLGDTIGIEIDHVEVIPPAPGGKSRLVVSHYDPADAAAIDGAGDSP